MKLKASCRFIVSVFVSFIFLFNTSVFAQGTFGGPPRATKKAPPSATADDRRLPNELSPEDFGAKLAKLDSDMSAIKNSGTKFTSDRYGTSAENKKNREAHNQKNSAAIQASIKEYMSNNLGEMIVSIPFREVAYYADNDKTVLNLYDNHDIFTPVNNNITYAPSQHYHTSGAKLWFRQDPGKSYYEIYGISIDIARKYDVDRSKGRLVAKFKLTSQNHAMQLELISLKWMIRNAVIKDML